MAKNKLINILIGGGVVVLIGYLMWLGQHNQNKKVVWSANTSGLAARLEKAGIPALKQEGQALHIHQHLDIYVNGKFVQIPERIGIASAGAFISPIHVHDRTGLIHVESPTIETFTLGQLFDVWGVKLSSECIGEYCAKSDADGDEKLKIFSNGELYAGDPRDLVLESHQEIVIAYGTDAELPNPIPSSYTFPPGE